MRICLVILSLLYSTQSISQCGYYFKSLGASLNKVRFWDEQNGIIIGDQSVLMTTNNGGNTWQNPGLPFFQSLTIRPLVDVCIADPVTAYVVGEYGIILKTTDKGATWKRLLGINGEETFTGIYFTDAQNGYITGHEGLVYKTTDGGMFWTRLNVSQTVNFRGVSFFDANRGFVW